MDLTGSITEIKARHSASGDIVQSLRLEVFGDFGELQLLLKKPLKITMEEIV